MNSPQAEGNANSHLYTKLKQSFQLCYCSGLQKNKTQEKKVQMLCITIMFTQRTQRLCTYSWFLSTWAHERCQPV